MRVSIFFTGSIGFIASLSLYKGIRYAQLQQHYSSLIDPYSYFHFKFQLSEMNPNSMIHPQDDSEMNPNAMIQPQDDSEMNPNSMIQFEDEDEPYNFQDGTSKLSLYLSGSLS